MFQRRDNFLLNPMPSRRREWPALLPTRRARGSRALASILVLALGGGLVVAATLADSQPSTAAQNTR